MLAGGLNRQRCATPYHVGKEELGTLASRTAPIDIRTESSVNALRQRQGPAAAVFNRWHRKLSSLPIDAVEAKCDHLCHPQAEVHHADRHRVVTTAVWLIAGKRSQQSPALLI